MEGSRQLSLELDQLSGTGVGRGPRLCKLQTDVLTGSRIDCPHIIPHNTGSPQSRQLRDTPHWPTKLDILFSNSLYLAKCTLYWELGLKLNQKFELKSSKPSGGVQNWLYLRTELSLHLIFVIPRDWSEERRVRADPIPWDPNLWEFVLHRRESLVLGLSTPQVLARASWRRGTMGREERSARTASTPLMLFTRIRFSFRKLRMEAAKRGKTSMESYARTRSQR